MRCRRLEVSISRNRHSVYEAGEVTNYERGNFEVTESGEEFKNAEEKLIGRLDAD